MKDAACQVDDNLQLHLTLSEGISDMFYKTQPLPRIDKKSKNLDEDSVNDEYHTSELDVTSLSKV